MASDLPIHGTDPRSTAERELVALGKCSQQVERELIMAETKKGTKFLRVPGYTKADGTKVRSHDRSTPCTSTGKAKGGKKR
jgi:hypothetical protein